MVRRTLREFTADECTDLAAALTYYAVLAVFPAAIALLSLLGLGDVRWITEGVDGTYVSNTYEPEDLAGLLKKALGFGARTQGRNRIVDLGLTSEMVAQKLIRIYTA